jgi:arylsulfatase A-like enzyme
MLLAVAAVSLAVVGGAGGGTGPPPAAATPARPDIVLILTDDQRFDTLFAMHRVRHRLIEHGVKFARGLVPNAKCCPSRASILTGGHSHSTGVYNNTPPHGGFESFDDSSTIATWLNRAGYTTGFVGRYLNGYEGLYVPPGWDRWVAFSGRDYPYNMTWNYRLNVDGRWRSHGDTPADYATDVLATEAEAFVRRTEGRFFLLFAPYAPHPPAAPAPRHADRFAGIAPWRPPSYDEPDVSDKPSWVRSLPRLSAERREYADALRRRQLASLLAVDQAVGRIVDALRQTGRLGTTLIAFTSDNGYLWGEHRWIDKVVAYEEAIRVPYVVRYDPLVTRPRTDRHLVANIDLAATFAHLGGVAAPGAEGSSLLPLLADPGTPWRDALLLEHLQAASFPPPTFCGVRTGRHTYVRYRSGAEELYDLHADPYQLRNIASDPGAAGVVRKLRPRLVDECTPPPPGYRLP